ncbi:MAG: Actin-binding protein [Wolbachia endosymbiont of Ctenocephalides orientis wCori]|nr:MAG: Actin-binding protein [Wolbachia endosymbiont of Ctenocephalides orientis wCori]
MDFLISKDDNAHHSKDKYGRTPLHLAALRGHLDVVKSLIEKGADAKAEDKHGHTPIHLAAENGHLDSECC